jgi:hypothetical protein
MLKILMDILFASFEIALGVKFTANKQIKHSILQQKLEKGKH